MVALGPVAQVGENLAHPLEADPGVEQLLHHAQLEQVAVRVPPPASAAGGVGERRPDEVRARPVIELPVADADDLRGPSTAEPLLVHVRALLRVHRPWQHGRSYADVAPSG
jgi:hypothetical protein